MITSIEITKGARTIPNGFKLDLGRITVITGKNNSGKTSFLKLLLPQKSSKKDTKKSDPVAKFLSASGEEIYPKIIYIGAENIQPNESECKASAKGTGLITNLRELFASLGGDFRLKEQDSIVNEIKNLLSHASENLAAFTGEKNLTLQLNENSDGLAVDSVLQALISSISSLEDGEERALDELGQGTQRVIIVSMLKAYVDLLISRGKIADKKILILFEEPEIYLHPELKRLLNSTLRKIAGQDNHQIVIVTHDPYFVSKNISERSETKFYSFAKTKNITGVSAEGVIAGIEDEFLFSYLYSLIEGKNSKLLKLPIPNFIARKYYEENVGKKIDTRSCSNLEYIRHQIHHLGDNPYTIGLVLDVLPEYKELNYYTQDELSNAVKMMSDQLRTK